MKPSEYQQLASRTECDQISSKMRMAGAATMPPLVPNHLLLPIRLNHGAIGIVKEGSEVLSLLEKWVYYNKPLDTVKIKEELGDVLWYVSLVCNAIGLDMGEVMEANIRKLQARYPDKFTEELAADENRNRELEAQAVAGTGKWDNPNTPPGDRSGS